MDISTALAADLAVLAEGLGTQSCSTDGLAVLLRSFETDVTSAISSYQGLSVALVFHGCTIRFTTRDAKASAATTTSLLIPLSALTTACDGHLALFAATPGTFVDLAADLGHCLRMTVVVHDHDCEAPMDAHSAPAPTGPGMAGLKDFSTINRATGVLMADGHSPNSARTELIRRATVQKTSLHLCAQTVLDSRSGRHRHDAL